jgi:hypothetical protein
MAEEKYDIGCDVHPAAPVEGCSGCEWINKVKK